MFRKAMSKLTKWRYEEPRRPTDEQTTGNDSSLGHPGSSSKRKGRDDFTMNPKASVKGSVH